MQSPPPTYRSRLLVAGLTVAAVLVLLSTGRVTSNLAGAGDGSAGLERLMRRLPYPDEDAVSIEALRDGSVWVATRHGITRFAGGDPARPFVLLDPTRHRERFARHMQPLSVARVRRAGGRAESAEVWAGAWTGQVLRHVDGAWLEVSSHVDGPVEPIRAIAFDGPDVYVASRGLWRWSDTSRELESVDGLERGIVAALAKTPEGELLAAVDGRVMLRQRGVWRTLWEAPRIGDRITAVLATRAGEVAIGTRDGLRVLDTWGRVRDRSLSGHEVHAFAEGPDGTLWAGTRERGFYLRRPEGWYRVRSATDAATRRLRTLAVGADDRLWLGLRGSGLHVSQPDPLASVAARR